MSVKVKMVPNWESKILAELKVGLLEMVVDVHKKSVILAPKDTRALVNSSKIKDIAGGYKVTYGSDSVPYARIQELGGETGKGGSVTIEGKHYLSEAADTVARGNLKKYFEVK